MTLLVSLAVIGTICALLAIFMLLGVYALGLFLPAGL